MDTEHARTCGSTRREDSPRPTFGLDLARPRLLARRAVSSLLGHHDLWRGDWPGSPVALLTEDEKQTLAHDDAPWHDPEHAALLVWIREEGATPRSRAE